MPEGTIPPDIPDPATSHAAHQGPLLPPGPPCTPGSLSPYLERMILSASGWRAVFAADGDEESRTPRVREEHLVLGALAARAFDDILHELGADGVVVVGRDTRPTGPLIARAAVRTLLARDRETRLVGIAASPEIMAYARCLPAAGFFYVSASHNPAGHNGLKMGLGDGGVAGGELSRTLIARFRELASDPQAVRETALTLQGTGDRKERAACDAAARHKAEAIAAYRGFTEEVARGPGPKAAEQFRAVGREIRARQPGIIADMNGSARTVSIDREFLTSLGCRLEVINAAPGAIAHRIVPEGDALSQCLSALEEAHSRDRRFFLGYVPDNDGDRGNLVVAAGREVRQLAAQEVFALACVAELGWLRSTGVISDAPPIVVVNGPTSLRIDRIAEGFGAEVQRAEVGEANVVARARELRAAGRLVRFLGEGSNGGNITHPAAVRDPLQTVLSVLKLLHAPPAAGPAPADGPQRDLAAVLQSLPRFTTTSAYEPLAVMQVRASDHGALKNAVEDLWEAQWPSVAPRLEEALGVTSYAYENYEGTRVTRGPRSRSGAGRGGFKILLKDAADVARAFLWMRGSGTEPVFRVMVDVEGEQPDLERELLRLLRDLVERADAKSAAG